MDLFPLVATEKQIRIIDVLLKSKEIPLTLSCIAFEAKVNRTAVRNLVKRGIRLGMIEVAHQDTKSKYYRFKKVKA